jgi:hypothetical protein
MADDQFHRVIQSLTLSKDLKTEIHCDLWFVLKSMCFSEFIISLHRWFFFNCSYKHRTRWLGKVKDTKGARRSSNWKNRQYTSKRNRQNDKLWSATYIKENKRLNNSNPTKITGMNSSDLEEEAIPAPLMTPVVVGIG